MISINRKLTPAGMAGKIENFWAVSGNKIRLLQSAWSPRDGSPVFTVAGKYTARGWTEWTQGFQFGSAILQFEAGGDSQFLDYGRKATVDLMAPHVSHMGVHDHGFNNASTYGNLLRLIDEGKIAENEWERRFYELALKASGAVQARRWTRTADGGGFIYSFNGPHSLFVDTIRSLRSLALAHKLGHVLMEENDARVSLLTRLVAHLRATLAHNVYYGEGRDAYDVRGRVVHESIFNTVDGNYRCPSTQQGYSPFSTWTRGLAWALLGCAEQLEFLQTRVDEELEPLGGRRDIEALLLRAARATADFYIENSPLDGVPYWDTGAPGLANMPDWRERESDPFNDFEPVDSSAAAIAAQGLLRLGHYLLQREKESEAVGSGYFQVGLTVLDTLLGEPYLSESADHQGLILHSVYHRPRGWDYVPSGRKTPCGESSMWGDYHAREAALYVLRLAGGGGYLTFF